MKWWIRFWKRRKQDDRIKIMLIFLMTGIGFLINAVYSGMQIYAMVQTPVEYIVRSNGKSGITEYQMSGIETMENLQAVSKQKESSLTLSDSWGEMTVTCLELSDTYLESAYGISETSAMKVIYLNEMAWEQLAKASGGSGNGVGMMDGELESEAKQINSMQLDYILGGEDGEKGTAKILCIASGVPNDMACAFCTADNVRLSEGNSEIRLRLSRQDLEGTSIGQINQFGLEVTNSSDMQIDSMRREMKFMQIKYDVIVVVLCLIAAYSLKRKRGI